MAYITDIKTFAVLGAGVIGSGWAARALANGLDVIAWDPSPTGEQTLRANIANAWPALERVGLKPGASQSRLKVVKTVEEAVKDADFVQVVANLTFGLIPVRPPTTDPLAGLELAESYSGFSAVAEPEGVRVRACIPVEQMQGFVAIQAALEARNEGTVKFKFLSSVKLSEAGFGGGEGFFFFAESETDLGGAVVRIVVEAGAGHGCDADFFDEIFCETHVARGGGKRFGSGSGNAEMSVMM